MAAITLERLAAGIKAANAKGDVEAVKRLGAAYRQMQGGATQPLYQVGSPAGMVAPGNLDLNARTVYHAKPRDQAGEDFRTEKSMSIGTDQGEVLIPTVVNGRQLTPEQAIEHFQQTGENLGTFQTPEAADAYAENLHQRQASYYAPRSAPTKTLDQWVADKRQGEKSSNVEWAPGQGPQPATPRPDLLSSTMATVNGLSASVPFLQNTTDAIGGTIAQLTGGKYQDYVDRQRALREGWAKQAPIARLSGEVGGTLGGMGAAATTKLGAEAFGLTGDLWKRVLNSGLSSAGLGTADALSRGETGADALASGGLNGAIGAALPVVGATLRLGGRQVKKSIIDPVATMLAPENAVTANLGKSIAADKAAGAVMSSSDEATARSAGVPVTNADRFGPAVRRLTRTASNIDDEAKAKLSRAVEDRFTGQSGRAENFVRQLMGGATDDLALKDALRAAADQSNSLTYGKAMNDPNARAVWSQPLRELMSSPTFKSAIDAAEARGADRAAISGVKAVRNPFVFDANGNLVGLRKMPDGSTALPSLQFWDQVKRNLDGMIDQVRPTPLGGGDRTKYADLTAMKRKLVAALDEQVPAYAEARSKAAAFFGAEDAIDVGRKALTMTKQLPEMQRAHAALTKAEKDAAAVGYASEMIDTIKASGDNRNLAISRLFNSPEARARTELFLGPSKARQLEAYVRVESIVDQLRGAVRGNSTTAEQLIAAGAVGTGVGLATGDWQRGLTVGALAGLGMRGLKAAGKNVDEQVMRRVAEILLSGDPKLLERAIHNASLSKAHMDALEGIMLGMSVTARGSALAAVN